MPTIRSTFKKIKLKADKTVKCKTCGRLVSKQNTFFQTMSPFNTDNNGVAKSEHQIKLELADTAIKWKTKKEVCNHCEGGKV